MPELATALPRLLTALLVLATGPAAARAAATPAGLLAPAVERLAVRSVVVAVGEVAATEARWNDEQTKIHTYVTYRIEQTIRGSVAGPTLVVRQLGGEIGRIGQMVVGGPTFSVGDRDLLFLVVVPGGHHANGAPEYQLTGFVAGKLPVELDPGTGQELVRLEVGGCRTIPAGAASLVGPGTAAPRPVPLADALAELRRLP